MTPDQRWSADDRIDEAADCIDEALERGHFANYARVVGELPLLLSQHGLGQTLACFLVRGAGREASPYELVYQQMTRRLAEIFRVTDRDLLRHLTRSDSQQYLRMAEEARLFARALYDEVEAQAYAASGEEVR